MNRLNCNLIILPRQTINYQTDVSWRSNRLPVRADRLFGHTTRALMC